MTQPMAMKSPGQMWPLDPQNKPTQTNNLGNNKQTKIQAMHFRGALHIKFLMAMSIEPISNKRVFGRFSLKMALNCLF